MQVQELVGIVPWTFIAQICNLFLQMYLIKRFLFKPVNEMLQKRRAMADAEIQDATKAKKEAIAMKTEYEQNMQQAKTKASDIVNEAQRTASLQSEEILKSAAQEARAMKEKAGDDSLQAYLISLAKKDVTTIQYTLEKTNGRRGDKESVRTDEIHS